MKELEKEIATADKPKIEFKLVAVVRVPVASTPENPIERYKQESVELCTFSFDEMFELAKGANPIPDKFKDAISRLFT